MPRPKRAAPAWRTKVVVLACCFGLLVFADPAQGQDAGSPSAPPATSQSPSPATPASASAPAASSVWRVHGVDISGFVDGYFSGNFNNPASRENQLQSYDVRANQFSLEMAKVALARSSDPVGFQLDLGVGKAFDILHMTEPNGARGYLRNVEQAYISLKPAKTKGFEADFGQFVTSAGAEVIDTLANWNYSHSLLYSYATPDYHFGLRTSMPLTSAFTGGIQVVNGWNDTADNNTGKTLGVTGVYTKPKYSLHAEYYVGPENPNTNVGFRNLVDAYVELTPNAKLSAYLNYDYGQNRKSVEDGQGHYTAAGLGRWEGIAGAAHYQMTARSSLSPRAEYFIDPQGFTTGRAQTLNEFTLTYEYKMLKYLLARVEFRNDHSTIDFFDKGQRPASVQNQPGLTLGVIAFFGAPQ